MSVPLDDDVLGVRLAKIRLDRAEADSYLRAAARLFGESSERYLDWEQCVTTLKLMLVQLEAQCIAAEVARQRAQLALREYDEGGEA